MNVLFKAFIARLKQPSTHVGLLTAVVTLANSAAITTPTVVSTLLGAFGLVIVNA